MSEFIVQSFHRLIAENDLPYKRYLYKELGSKHRLLGIVGPRGVGKTSMMLQYIKNELYDGGGAFYFSADNAYFAETSLLAFVDELYQSMNIRHVFIDEVHKYPNWNQELKNIYDSFPSLKVVFSGSSSIDLIRGSYDLSRRAKLLQMKGLSFREYLNIKNQEQFATVTLEDIFQNHQQVIQQYVGLSTIMQQFQQYLLHGYYPTVFQTPDDVYTELSNIIEKTIYEDIAMFYSLKTQNLNHFRRILNFLASMPPGKVKTNNIAKHLQIDNKTADYYIEILQRTGLIQLVYADAHGNQLLTKPDKIYLDNTTLLAAQNAYLSQELNIGTLRELAFLQSLRGAGEMCYFPKQGDFMVDHVVVEIGGRNKTWQQLQNYQGKKYLVKDNFVMGYGDQIQIGRASCRERV